MRDNLTNYSVLCITTWGAQKTVTDDLKNGQFDCFTNIHVEIIA